MWVEITPDDGPSELRRKASTVRPSLRQVSWQRQELTAFVHFGPNTFTGLEWGTGLDDPAVFDPSGLDCGQWAAKPVFRTLRRLRGEQKPNLR